MRKSLDIPNLPIHRYEFQNEQVKHRSSYSLANHQDHSFERLSTDQSDRPQRFFRLSSRNSIKNPITGQIKLYPMKRSVSPLGFKNIIVPEKITSASYKVSEYFFERLTKRNPKMHPLNPITGESSGRSASKSFMHYDYHCNFTPEPRRPVRYSRGTGYQKSVIY